MPQSQPSLPSSSAPRFIDESLIIPPVAVVTEKETKPSTSAMPIIFVVISLMLIIAVVGVYGLYVLPRQNTVRLVDQLKPHITTLKAATNDVITNLDAIYALATEQEKSVPKPNLQTTGILIHPDIAGLANNAAILGASVRLGQKAIVEQGMRQVAKGLNGSIRMAMKSPQDVLGAVSTEDAYVQNFRSLKTETVKAGESVSKGQAAMAQVVTLTQSLPVLPSDARGKISGSGPIKISAMGYFSEAKKIADYYQLLSDIIIDMNTKITSFKSAIASAGNGFGAVMQSGNSTTAKTLLTQVQVFLDQAHKDMQDMKKLSEKLVGVSNESLPMASSQYHAHNIKVLEVATTYFVAQSDILQTLVTGANTVVEKGEKNMLTAADINVFQNQLTTGVSKSALSDAKFVSDLQSLQGEEGSLAISFWQNNTRLGDGKKVIEGISAYQTSLEKLRQEHVVKGLIQ